MKVFKIILTIGLLTLVVSAQAAERIYSCDILNGKHRGYRINVINSASGELKINLLSSMNTLVTYSIKSENLCQGDGYCVQAESKKKIEGKTMMMGLSISNRAVVVNGKSGLAAKATFDSFDLRNEPASVRVHEDNISLICVE